MNEEKIPQNGKTWKTGKWAENLISQIESKLNGNFQFAVEFIKIHIEYSTKSSKL